MSHAPRSVQQFPAGRAADSIVVLCVEMWEDGPLLLRSFFKPDGDA